jgi:hypothetical protein
MQIYLSQTAYHTAVAENPETVATAVKDAISAAVGNTLDADSLCCLNGEQITLWAYFILREEVMDGGFVQLIHNGYGPFFFHNPFAKAMRLWGLPELAKLINKAHRLYNEYGDELTRSCSDEDFMALFEKYPKFDDLDDEFIEMEEELSTAIGRYVTEHLEDFVTINAEESQHTSYE